MYLAMSMRPSAFLTGLLLLVAQKGLLSHALTDPTGAYKLRCAAVALTYNSYDFSRFDNMLTGYTDSSSTTLPWTVSNLGIKDASSSTTPTRLEVCYRITNNFNYVAPTGFRRSLASTVRPVLKEVRFMLRNHSACPQYSGFTTLYDVDHDYDDIDGFGGNYVSAAYSACLGDSNCKGFNGYGQIKSTVEPSVFKRGACLYRKGAFNPFDGTVTVDAITSQVSPLVAPAFVSVPISTTASAALSYGKLLTVCLVLFSRDIYAMQLNLAGPSRAVDLISSTGVVFDPNLAVTQVSLVSTSTGLKVQQACGDSFDAFNITGVTLPIPQLPVYCPQPTEPNTDTNCGGGTVAGANVCTSDQNPKTDQGCVAAYFMCKYQPMDDNTKVVRFCGKNSLTNCQGIPFASSSICGYGTAKSYCCSLYS